MGSAVIAERPYENPAGRLICLKGGDLAQEIFESGLRPKMMPVDKVFAEEYFAEKFVLHVAK
jgi:16S rRNA (guanine527-N7)-methyltransferase